MTYQKASAIIGCLLATIVINGCASVPLDVEKTASSALVDTDDTTLGKASADWRAADTGRNGFYPLIEGFDAFGARLLLMDQAERSIDAQYFLMKPDDAGLVFAAKLKQAADRGVRVRFLLDDIFTSVDDEVLILLDEHPNIELRIFNPISRKGSSTLNYVGNFKLTNRRMHNKSFTVDNQLAVVGGRNIAEEYFQLDSTGEFIDFDMLTAGPVVKDISASFDTYWNHELAVPMSALYDQRDVQKLDARRTELSAAMQDSGESIYGEAVNTELVRKILGGNLDPYYADARTIIDDPQKLLVKISRDQQIVAKAIADALLDAEEEIIIFTPYFIPGKAGMELIETIRAKGVRIVLVTNSLASNNHTPVHSAYSSYRKRLLKAGVELYEARADAAQVIREDGSKELEQLTLHTKGLVIDRRYTFVGSLNLDPRSIEINTEMGVMIDSTDLGARLAENSNKRIANITYQLRLDDKDKISWHANIDGQEVVETKEPLTTAWRRFQAWFLKIAPEKQL